MVGVLGRGQDVWMIQLYAESFAPWCEKARWALDHHAVPYRYTEHVPMVGEPRLRMAARRWRGCVTVPLLVTPSGILMDSVAIARAAEALGEPSERRAASLFPVGQEAALEHWNDCSEAVMTSGRTLLMSRLLNHPAALREQLPPFVPQALRPVLQPLAARGTRFLVRKYGIQLNTDARHVSRIRAALNSVRDVLSSGRRRLLDGGAFSFADITVATSLQFILPVADGYMPLGPATREVWTHPELAEEFADLLAWRDELYRAHRPPSAASPARASPAAS